LNALTDEVVVLLDDEASRTKISVISGASEELIDQEAELMIKANRNRIKQILINLIENAIRYNIEGGKVIVESSRPDDEHVVINVSDTGQGIPAEHLPRIFERFYRVDKGRSRELGGTGLGLSIVKHIAMLYEGSVSAQSTPGEGTVISVILRV
jgi:two-component system phosphate regulon sensor histidine kinase PhoR